MKKYFWIVVMAVFLFLSGGLVIFFNSNYYYSKKLITAIEAEDLTAVKNILEKKPECINTYPSITPKWWHSVMGWRINYPLNEACGTDNMELVEMLIEYGADVNCNDGRTPLSITYGLKGEHWYRMSLLLIESGANLNYSTEYSAGMVCVLENIVNVRPEGALSGYIPESEEEVKAAFYYAIENCDHSQVDWMSVLQESVSCDRLEIVRFLLDNDYCDVNDTSHGMTALMFAARDSTPEMVALLLGYGAEKDYVSSDGETAYDYAVKFNNEDIVSLLTK